MCVLIMVGVIWQRKNSRPRNLDVVLEMMERTPRPPAQSTPPDDETSASVSISVSAGLTSVKYTPNADSSKMAALILDNLETRCSTITENASVIQ